MTDYTQLPVWLKSHQLALKFYKVTAAFPASEFLTSQIRAAATAVPMNIVAGCGRDSRAEGGRLFGQAMDSASQLDYLLLLARDLNLVGSFDYDLLHSELMQIKRLLTATLPQLGYDRA